MKIWFGLVEPFKSYHLNFGGGRNPLLGGFRWPAMPIFELGGAIPLKSHVRKFGSDWLSLSRVILSTNIFSGVGGGAETSIRGVTFDLWCPFSNSDVIFQSKAMCENLVWIGWNRRYVNFEGGRRAPIRGRYMWPAMPIFELGRGILDKSHVRKFGSDWLRLSRVIMVTSKRKKKKIIIIKIKRDHRRSSN